MPRSVTHPFLVLAALAASLAAALVAADACKNTVGPGGEGEVFEGEGDSGAGEGEGEGGGPQCASGPVFGILVEPTDPCTSFRICGATATASDGTTSETLAPTGSDGSNCAYQGALDKAGTYTVTFDAPQYTEKTFPGVVVTLDPCGHAVQNIVKGDVQPIDGCAQ